MKSPLVAFLGISFLALASGGCSDDTGNPVLSACSEIQHVVLTRNAACPGDRPNPVSDEWISFLCGRLVNEVSLGHVTFDPTAVAACEAQLASAPCDDLQNPTEVTPCKTVFMGVLAAGGACTDDSECASGLCTFQVDQDTHLPLCPGACEFRVPIGGACAAGSGATTCARSLFCIKGLCTTTRGSSPTGAACTQSAECITPDRCEYESGETCQPLLADGVACQSGPQCQSLSCRSNVCAAHLADGAPCGSGPSGNIPASDCASGVCTFNEGGSEKCASVHMAEIGQPCGVASDGSSETWCHSGFCRIESGTMGTCTALFGSGLTCSNLSTISADHSATPSAPCVPGTFCVRGFCRPVDACGVPAGL